jgi:hypothetical protein
MMALTKPRFQIADLLIAILIPAAITAVLPNTKPIEFALCYVVVLIFSFVAFLYSASLSHAFAVQSLWSRAAVHLYVFVAVMASLIWVPVLSAVMIMFSRLPDRWFSDVFAMRTAEFILVSICLGLSGSLIFVERARRRADYARQNSAQNI